MMTMIRPSVAARVLLLLSITGLVSACGVTESVMRETAQRPPVVRQRPAEDRDKAMQFFVSGSLYEIKEQFSQAVLEYQDALRYAPNESAIHFALAKSYRRLNKLETAIYHAKKSVELDASEKWYFDLLGQLYFEAQEFDKAADAIEKFCQKDPTNTAALYLLAAAYGASENYEKSLAVYDRILQTSGADMEALYKKLLLLLQLKRDDDALMTLLQMIIVDPNNTELYQMLGELYIKSGRYDEALGAFQEIIERNPNDMRALVGMSEIYIKKRNWLKFDHFVDKMFTDAKLSLDEKLNIGEIYLGRAGKDSSMLRPTEIVMQKLQKQYPKEWKPYWFLGVVQMEQRNLDGAIQNFKALTTIKPDLTVGWENLGIAYLQKGDHASSIAAFKSALKKLPKAPFRLKMLLGFALSQAGQDSETIIALEDALRSNESIGAAEKVQMYSTLGIAYDRLGKYLESQRSYEEALKVDPENALVLNNLAYSLSERDQQLERCLEMAKIAVQKEPDNGAFLDTIGWVYFKLGRYDDAREWIEKAIATGRSSAVVIEHLGDVYHKLGKREKAMEYWQQALDLNKQNVSLRQKMNANR